LEIQPLKIKELLTSGSSFVLLKVVLSKQFMCKREVGKANPLSALMFVLSADLLQSAIKYSARGDIQVPIQIRDPDFLILLYAWASCNGVRSNPLLI
jgi:hypothetical protein